MQVYLNQTVLPLLATEMGARNAYGLVTAAAQVPAFLTMPLGGAMLTRWRPARLMTVLTTLLVSGAVVGALAPNIEFYVLGEILRGSGVAAAGALATATMGVMVTGLPDAWRRLCLAVGRRAGIATLMWVCAFFLTLDYLVAPSAHDVLDMTPTQIGWALTAGGIGWSVVALVCGAHPAREPKAYRRRTTLAAAFFVLGAALMTTTVLGRPGWWGLPVGYGVAGIDMGLTHLDTMNRIVTDPAEPDGITHAQAATAVTIAGAAGGAVLGTVTTAFVAPRHPVSRRTGCGRHSSCSPWGSSSPRCWPDAPPERSGGLADPWAVASPPCGSFVCAEPAIEAAPRRVIAPHRRGAGIRRRTFCDPSPLQHPLHPRPGSRSQRHPRCS